MINKVQPVYNTLDYWHKYRPWAHKYLRNYTNDPDVHGNLDTELWYLLKRILSNVKDPTTLVNYIKESIRGKVKRLKDRLGYKYKKRDLQLSDVNYEFYEAPKLDITLDEYLNKQALLKYINLLPQKQIEVIKQYFGIDVEQSKTQVQIAQDMNVSQPRIYNLKEMGLKRLRSIMNSRNIYSIEDFINGKE